MASHALAVLSALILACPGVAPRSAGQQPPAASEFEGVYLGVTLRSDADTFYVLEKCQVRRLGDQSFLVGVGADTGSADKWYVGIAHWVALGDVSTIQVYPTLERLKAAQAAAAKAAAKLKEKDK